MIGFVRVARDVRQGWKGDRSVTRSNKQDTQIEQEREMREPGQDQPRGPYFFKLVRGAEISPSSATEFQGRESPFAILRADFVWSAALRG